MIVASNKDALRLKAINKNKILQLPLGRDIFAPSTIA